MVSRVLIAVAFCLVIVCRAQLAEGIDNDGPNDDELDRLTEAIFEAAKRSAKWSSLHSTWGKRAGWSNLQGGWGKRSANDDLAPEREEDSIAYDDAAENDDDHGSDTRMKRNWNNIRPSWGKREEDRDWNAFRGSWGKRYAVGGSKPRNVWGKRPSWKQLSMWGKRSRQWNQLTSSWGKRSDDDEAFDQEDKRAWNKITPMWGKRNQLDLASLADELEKRAQAGWSHLSGAWGKRAPGAWKNLRGSWGKREIGEQHLNSAAADESGQEDKKPADKASEDAKE